MPISVHSIDEIVDYDVVAGLRESTDSHDRDSALGSDVMKLSRSTHFMCVQLAHAPKISANSLMSENNPKTNSGDKRKQSLYFPASVLEEIKQEAERLDRSLSWVVQRAWKVARETIKKMPGA